MTELEWRQKADRLHHDRKWARQAVYHGQPEEGKESAYRALREAEDALRLHLDNRPASVS